MEQLHFQDQVLNIKHIKLETPKMFQLIKLLLNQVFTKVLDIRVEQDQDLDQDQESTKAVLDQESTKVALDQESTKVDQVHIKADQEITKPAHLEHTNPLQEPIKLDLQAHLEAQAPAIKPEAVELIKLETVELINQEAVEPIKPEAINHINLDPIDLPLVLPEQLEQQEQQEQLAQPAQLAQLAAAFLLLIDTRRNE